MRKRQLQHREGLLDDPLDDLDLDPLDNLQVRRNHGHHPSADEFLVEGRVHFPVTGKMSKILRCSSIFSKTPSTTLLTMMFQSTKFRFGNRLHGSIKMRIETGLKRQKQ